MVVLALERVLLLIGVSQIRFPAVNVIIAAFCGLRHGVCRYVCFDKQGTGEKGGSLNVLSRDACGSTIFGVVTCVAVGIDESVFIRRY